MIVMSEPSSYREVYDSPKGRWGRIKIPRVPTNSKGLGIGGQSIKRGMTDCWGMERESPSDTLLSDFHHPDSHPSIGSLGRFDSSLQWISHPSCCNTGGTDCEEKDFSIDLRGREKEAMDCLPRHRNKERTGVTLVYTDRQMVAWVLSPFSMVRRKTASIDLGQEIQLALVKQSFFGGSDDPFFSLVREKVGSSSTCNNFIMLCGTIEIKELGNAYHHGGPESFISGAWASFKGGSIGFLFVTALWAKRCSLTSGDPMSTKERALSPLVMMWEDQGSNEHEQSTVGALDHPLRLSKWAWVKIHRG